jgi:hypothetical protein
MAKLNSGTRIYGNVTVDTFVTATGNVIAGNVLTAGLISATGNVTGNYFIGNGSLLTGISGGGGGSSITNGTSNVVVAASGNVTVGVAGTSNVVTFTTTGANITGTLSVSGVSNLGAVGNVIITGGTNGYVLSTNGSGVLSWVAQPTTASITVDNFTGNGVQTAFTLSVTPANINQTSVNYDGVVQLRTAYSLAGAVLTFTEAPSNGSLVEVTTTSLTTGGGGGGGGTPGGANTQVQFNDANTFGGSSGFVFDKTSNALTVNGIISGGFLIENSQTVSANYTITAGKSASSAGPITIDSGIVVTVTTGSRWVIL